MSDVTGTVVKLLSSLVSPKSSFKVLFIAASLTLCWMYIQPQLIQLHLPSEISFLVILFTGLGIGSLLCDLASHWFFSLVGHFQKRRQKKILVIEEALAQERRYETERIFLDKFKQAYEHFDSEMKNLLRSLIKNNKAFHGTSAVNSLYANKLICKVADIDNSKKLYSINPLIADYVQAQWEAEIQSGLDDFFVDFSPLKSACLDMLELNECSFDGKIRKLKKSLFTNKHLLSPVLRTTYTRPDESFFIYFNDGYLSSMEKRLSKSFIDEIEIILK